MIWADRVTIVFGLLCGLVVLLNTDPTNAANHSIVIVLFLWFVLRAVDFVFTGQIRTRAKSRAIP